MLERLADTPEMRRLSDIGMHCGCEYSGVPFYKRASKYTRLTHSIGAAKIVWRFTKDLKQAAAGMLHDIATPVFAHTIDFLDNDYLDQESTESKTAELIENSASIVSLLGEYGISADDVSDYKRYPIADNDTPMLSADRLEYTLGNAYTVFHPPLEQIREIYDDLTVAVNERGCDELCFRTVRIAEDFVRISLRNSNFFVSKEDRFLMQYLADAIRGAISAGALTRDDLFTTETEVIEKLKGSGGSSALWNEYTRITAVAESDNEMRDRYCVRVTEKKRHIDPLVRVPPQNSTEYEVKRVSELNGELKMRIDEFLRMSFDRWLYAE